MAVPSILRQLNPFKSRSEYERHADRTRARSDIDTEPQQPVRAVNPLRSALSEAPINDPDKLPMQGTPEYDSALGRATPVVGDAPAPPVWNPIRTDPSGRPRISETAVGSTSETQRKEYDALQKWNPRAHEHKENRLLSALKSAGLAIKANPEYATDPLSLLTLAATGAARGGISRATPDIYRRKIALRETGQQLNQSMALDKEAAQIAGVNSQADAREQNLLLQAERNQRENEKLGQGERKIRNAMRVARGRELLLHLNGMREFDPNDPKNGAFVEAFTETFGYPPGKHVSGSLLDLREEYDAEGNLRMRVYDKGTGTSKVFDTPPGTASRAQADRESREAQGKAGRDSRERIAGNAEVGRNNRFGARGATPTGPRGGLSKSETKSANSLVREYNDALATEKILAGTLDPKNPARAASQRARENLWQEVFDTYPGVFEADSEGKLKMKSRPSSSSGGPTLDGALRAFRTRAKREPTAEEIANIKRHYGLQ